MAGGGGGGGTAAAGAGAGAADAGVGGSVLEDPWIGVGAVDARIGGDDAGLLGVDIRHLGYVRMRPTCQWIEWSASSARSVFQLLNRDQYGNAPCRVLMAITCQALETCLSESVVISWHNSLHAFISHI